MTADFQPRPERMPSDDLSAGIFSLLNEFSLFANNRGRTGAASSARGRNQAGSSSSQNSRSRSPRNRSLFQIVVGSNSRDASNETNNENGNRNGAGGGAGSDIRIRFGVGRGGYFTFPVEDVMSSILSAPRQPAMTDNQLEEIPKASITAEDVTAQIQCAVCFEDYLLNENDVRKLPCNHLFHEKCIFPWLKNNATCPVCRSRMPNANEENEDSSDMDEEMFSE